MAFSAMEITGKNFISRIVAILKAHLKELPPKVLPHEHMYKVDSAEYFKLVKNKSRIEEFGKPTDIPKKFCRLIVGCYIPYLARHLCDLGFKKEIVEHIAFFDMERDELYSLDHEKMQNVIKQLQSDCQKWQQIIKLANDFTVEFGKLSDQIKSFKVDCDSENVVVRPTLNIWGDKAFLSAIYKGFTNEDKDPVIPVFSGPIIVHNTYSGYVCLSVRLPLEIEAVSKLLETYRSVLMVAILGSDKAALAGYTTAMPIFETSAISEGTSKVTEYGQTLYSKTIA